MNPYMANQRAERENEKGGREGAGGMGMVVKGIIR